ncbi:MAG: hypothetical protein WA580_05610, partial [Acidimicrobiales bacterium]
MNNPRRIQRHLVRAAAAGALLAAAALPLAIATSAGAVTVPTVTSLSFTPHGATASTVASGATGTVAITGTNFIDDGGTVTLTSSGADFTFSSVVETSTTTATANYSATNAAGTVDAAAGTFDTTIVDNSGTSTTDNDLTVTAAPTFTDAAPTPIYEGTGANTVTITGSGFETGATVTFASDGDGPTVGGTAVGTGLTDSVTSVSADGTTIVLSVTPTNPANSAAATLGGYDVIVANPDGGSVDSGPDAFTVTNGIQEVSPSAVPGTASTSTDTVALTGSGFEPGATVYVGNTAAVTPAVTTDPAACSTQITVTSASVTTGNSATLNFSEIGTGMLECTVSILNPDAAHGGNGDSYSSAAGALAVGEASLVAPIVTAATAPTTPVAVGAASTTTPVSLTGTGFSQYSQLGTSDADAADFIFDATTSSTGTSITAPVAVLTGANEGGVDVWVSNSGVDSAPLANAFSVAGPSVTSSSPAAVATSAGYGTTLTLTGTGFTPTTTGTLTGATGIVSYVSATSMTVTLTGAVTAAAGGDVVVNLTQATATGDVNTTFDIPVDAAPAVTSVSYPVGAPTEVGVGSKGTTVYLNGSGFATGATVTAFTNLSGVADPNVTATVSKVTSGQLTLSVAVTAPDTNTAVGYTVTNTDGGTVKVAASVAPILLGAGPTITGITPATGAAGATTAFTVAGTGFEAGAVVTLTPANGTCGAATVVSATSITVSCTLGTPSSVATDLVVTNPDGGSATGATAVLAAAAAKKAAFKVGATHGTAIAGKWSVLTISGSGFYGQPKITSNAKGSKIGVTKDTGKVLTVRVWTKKGISGEHTFTIRLASGKTGKSNYS